MSATEDYVPRGFVPMSEYRRVAQRCEVLEAELAEARDAIQEQSENEEVDWVRLELHLPRQCALVVLCLVRSRKPIERSDRLRELLGLQEGGCTNHVSVLVHRINCIVRDMPDAPKRLITGIPGSRGGYKIDPPQRAWLQRTVPQIFRKDIAR